MAKLEDRKMNMNHMTVEDLLGMDLEAVGAYNMYRDTMARLLERLDPKQPAGTPLCDAVMRIWTTNAFEALLFRETSTGQIEVFLRKRGPKEAYPGQWHAPGKLYRHGEQHDDVARRLKDEFGGEGIHRFVLIGHHITNEVRGTILSLLFVVGVNGDVRQDDQHGWFLVDHLPEPMVDFHRDVYIPEGAEYYRRHFRSLPADIL